MKTMKRLGTILALLAGLGLGTTAMASDPKLARLWKAKCGSCHGADGKGETAKGKKMKMGSLLTPEFKAKPDDEVRKAILEGVSKEEDGVKKEMDGYKDELSAEQIDSLIGFMRQLGDAK
jgi:mono/diheme cytochrome c family protein